MKIDQVNEEQELTPLDVMKLHDTLFGDVRSRWMELMTERTECSVPPGTYTPSGFASTVNTEILKTNPNFRSRLEFIEDQRRFIMKLAPGESVRFRGEVVREMMGVDNVADGAGVFINSHSLVPRQQIFRYPAYFAHDTEVAVVYTNLVQPSRMGTSMANYIRTVDISDRATNRADIIHRIFNDQYFVPCTRTLHHVIIIELRTLRGRPLPITRGTTTVVLHFKRDTKN